MMKRFSRSRGLVYITTVPDSLSFLCGQISFMRSEGFEVYGLSSPGKLLNEFGVREGMSVCAVEMPRRITPLRDLAALAHICMALRKIRPVIVHSHTPKGGLLGTIGAWLARVPVRVYHIHGLPLMTASGYKRVLLSWSEKVSCRLANQVLCVSHSVRKAAIDEKLCPEWKIKVLAGGSINGVDSDYYFNPDRVSIQIRADIRTQYGIPAEATVVGFVGRIVRDKGLIELCDAWALLRQSYPGLHLLVVGECEPQDPVPPSVKQTLQNDERIHLAGIQRDMPPLYAAMDLLVLPTYREGFPLVPMEAASMSLPVVATSVPGCVDAVQDGITGTLVPPKDGQALAEAVRAYLESPELRRTHGCAGRKRMQQHFRQENIWQATLQEYQRLLEEKGIPLSGREAEPIDKG